MDSPRSIEHLISAHAKNLGDGFTVRRALPQMQKRMVGPFIFFDHMGPVDMQIGHGLDVRPHPHIGLSTLTYLFDGEILHRDTLGVEQPIRPGAVNWMTAGRGVAHSERTPQALRAHTHRLHGIQTWIALPLDHEDTAPSFHHHAENEIPETHVNGSTIRVVAGEFQSFKSPVPVFSPVTYLDLQMAQGAHFEWQSPHELALYCVQGSLLADGRTLQPGELAVFSNSSSSSPSSGRIHFQAQSETRALLLGGTPFSEPRHIWWNFVSSSQDKIEQAKARWKERAFGEIRGETEFIPLP